MHAPTNIFLMNSHCPLRDIWDCKNCNVFEFAPFVTHLVTSKCSTNVTLLSLADVFSKRNQFAQFGAQSKKYIFVSCSFPRCSMVGFPLQTSLPLILPLDFSLECASATCTLRHLLAFILPHSSVPNMSNHVVDLLLFQLPFLHLCQTFLLCNTVFTGYLFCNLRHD